MKLDFFFCLNIFCILTSSVTFALPLRLPAADGGLAARDHGILVARQMLDGALASESLTAREYEDLERRVLPAVPIAVKLASSGAVRRYVGRRVRRLVGRRIRRLFGRRRRRGRR